MGSDQLPDSHFVESDHIAGIFSGLVVLLNLLLQGVDADEEVAQKQVRQHMDKPHVDTNHGKHPERLQEVEDKDNNSDDDPGGEKVGLVHSGAVDEEAAGDEVERGQHHSQYHHHKGQE